MGVVKHIDSFNARYSDVVDYLTMQHDEVTGKAIHDDQGNMLEREEYMIDGINCTPDTFAELCYLDSNRYNKNRSPRDVKTHQYIISYDPSDKEKGLTLEVAMQEGMRFARKNFPGHRVIVAAHPDGANGSGNIHVHIVISALRFEDREPNPEYMRLKKDGTVKASEYKAGYKHQDTARLRAHLFDEVQDFCRCNGYRVLEPKARKKVTDREYKAKKVGQKRLERDNETRQQQGRGAVKNAFVSAKDELRMAVQDAARHTSTWDDFADRLRHHYTRKVEVMPSYPRMSYTQKHEIWTAIKARNAEHREGLLAIKKAQDVADEVNRSVAEAVERVYAARLAVEEKSSQAKKKEEMEAVWAEEEERLRRKKIEEERKKLEDFWSFYAQMRNQNRADLSEAFGRKRFARTAYDNAMLTLYHSNSIIVSLVAASVAINEIKKQRAIDEEIRVLQARKEFLAANAFNLETFCAAYAKELEAGESPAAHYMDAVAEAVTMVARDLPQAKVQVLGAQKANQAKIKIYAKTYQVYATAAALAAKNDFAEEAKRCLAAMEELCRLQDGYWTLDPINTGATMLRDGELWHRATWRMIDQEDLTEAEKVLKEIKTKVLQKEQDIANAELREEAFPIDVKITRGVISYKHPDSEKWTRGKTLGADYEIDAIRDQLRQNQRRKTREAKYRER